MAQKYGRATSCGQVYTDPSLLRPLGAGLPGAAVGSTTGAISGHHEGQDEIGKIMKDCGRTPVVFVRKHLLVQRTILWKTSLSQLTSQMLSNSLVLADRLCHLISCLGDPCISVCCSVGLSGSLAGGAFGAVAGLVPAVFTFGSGGPVIATLLIIITINT